MTNSNIYAQNGLRARIINIEPGSKDLYYNAIQTAIKESPEKLEKRDAFWSYMMNVSMQNTVAQMVKMA